MNTTWIKFLNGILKMPGARVDRVQFLQKTFSHLSADEMRICIEEKPLKVLSEKEIDAAANSIISSHTTKVTAISAASGIPGGFAILATIPADLANYYYHVVSVGQKLGYLYGYPDMLDANERLTPDGEVMLTAFIGVMNQVAVARELIKKIAVEVSKRISEETATRVAGKLLQKQIVSQSAEMIAKRLGTQVTTKSGGRILSKAVPLLSGVICGAMTYATFQPQAKRLHTALKDTASNPN